MIRKILVGVVTAILLQASYQAGAQTYPTKTVRVVTAIAPGGSGDIGARLFASELSKRTGQPFIVENRVGGNTFIGIKYVIDATPDGYTLLFGGTVSLIPTFEKTNPIDAMKVLAPITIFMRSPFFLIVDAKLPVKNFQEFVAYTKANPGKVNFGSPSSAVPDLMLKLIQYHTGLVADIIPYKAGAQVVASMLNGEVAFTMLQIGPFLPQIQAGRMRALLSSGGKRFSRTPEVPTALEVGLKDYDIDALNGVWAPLGTPQPVIDHLFQLTTAALKTPEVAERIRNVLLAEPDGSTPAEYKALVERENRFWAEAARVAKYQPE